MKERPTLFSAPMILAILDGRKTMTRRTIKPQPAGDGFYGFNMFGEAIFYPRDDVSLDPGLRRCPYGQPGDRLWARETFGVCGICGKVGAYRATPTGEQGDACWTCNRTIEKWKPGIHMPRWASRITLEITAVRVERVQDISESDAEAEGVHGYTNQASPIDFFMAIWNRLNAKRGYGWDLNPFVWVLSFRKLP